MVERCGELDADDGADDDADAARAAAAVAAFWSVSMSLPFPSSLLSFRRFSSCPAANAFAAPSSSSDSPFFAAALTAATAMASPADRGGSFASSVGGGGEGVYGGARWMTSSSKSFPPLGVLLTSSLSLASLWAPVPLSLSSLPSDGRTFAVVLMSIYRWAGWLLVSSCVTVCPLSLNNKIRSDQLQGPN